MNSPLEGQDYLAHLAQFDDWNARAFLAIIVAFGAPMTYLDVGCGTGAMIRMARRLGIDAVGLDILAPPNADLHGIMKVDVSREFNILRKFALLTCIEVAEHIPEDQGGMLIRNIAEHAAETCLLIWTSAGPGQGGENHQTLVPGYVWRSMLHDHGLHYNEAWTHRLRLIWQAIGMPMMWLPDNLQVFDR
ncbi:MAG TPA: methyltransferase domain-containing protein [Tepidiformaceae bacterium]